MDTKSLEQKHHKDWMHSIYIVDPNGVMCECAYVNGTLPTIDAEHAYQIFVEKKILMKLAMSAKA